MRHRKIIFIISLLTGVVIFFIRCIGNNSSVGHDARGSQYADATSCGTCHKDIMSSYSHTSHFKTSAKASHDTLRKFIDSTNHLVYYADSNIVRLEEKQAQFFQSNLMEGKLMRSEKWILPSVR